MMVSAIVRWIKDRLGISGLERENLQLGKAIMALGKRIDESTETDVAEFAKVWDKCYATAKSDADSTEDHEARIAFLENRLTQKASEAKIVPKPKPVTFRQFAQAASIATENEESNG